MSDEEVIRDALAQTQLFVDLPDSVLDGVVQSAQLRRYPRGVYLHRVGDPVPGLYVVMSGALELSRLHPDGNRFVVEYLGPPSVNGIIGMVDGGCALFDVRAHASTVVVMVPRESVSSKWAEHPELLYRLSIALCERSRAIYEHAERLATLPLRQRMAHALSRLAARHGRTVSEGIEIGLRLSQDDMAAFLSASRQRINVELRQLAAQGLIRISYSRLTILDLEQLKRIGKGTVAA
ncbi:MAG: Crp/Fnr family transcriptional regulator [Burkholderiaceae bacterium]